MCGTIYTIINLCSQSKRLQSLQQCQSWLLGADDVINEAPNIKPQ